MNNPASKTDSKYCMSYYDFYGNNKPTYQFPKKQTRDPNAMDVDHISTIPFYASLDPTYDQEETLYTEESYDEYEQTDKTKYHDDFVNDISEQLDLNMVLTPQQRERFKR